MIKARNNRTLLDNVRVIYTYGYRLGAFLNELAAIRRDPLNSESP